MTAILYAVPSPVVPVIFGVIAGLRACLILKERSGDVDLALQQILVIQGGMDTSAAKRYLADLAREGRYQRDVY